MTDGTERNTPHHEERSLLRLAAIARLFHEDKLEQKETNHAHLDETLHAIRHTAQTTTLMAMSFSWALTIGGCGLFREHELGSDDDVTTAANGVELESLHTSGDGGVDTTTRASMAFAEQTATDQHIKPRTSRRRAAVLSENVPAENVVARQNIRSRFRRTEYDNWRGSMVEGRGDSLNAPPAEHAHDSMGELIRLH